MSDQEPNRTTETEKPAPPPTPLWKAPWQMPSRFIAWARSGLMQTLAALFLVLSIIVPGAIDIYLILNQKHDAAVQHVTMDEVWKALDEGNYTLVQKLAKQLVGQESFDKEEIGEPLMALGAATAYEAEEMYGKEQQKMYLLAAGYLDEAQKRGLTDDRQGECLYLLGKSQFYSGQKQTCRAALIAALKESPKHKTDIHALLAESYLSDAKPKLDRALENNTAYLSDKTLRPNQRTQGLLQRAQILLRLDKLDDCLATTAQIPAESRDYASALIVRSQALMKQASALIKKENVTENDLSEAREKYQQAIKDLRLAQTSDITGNQAARQAMYLIGVCFMQTKEERAANEQFERTHNQFPETPEASAAWIQQGELLRRLGRDAEYLAALRSGLTGVTSIEKYDNPWISIEELQAMLNEAFQNYNVRKQYDLSTDVALAGRNVLPPKQLHLWLAEVYGTWGDALLEQAEKSPQKKRDAVRRSAYSKFVRSGRNYAELAELYLETRQYTDQVWFSAMSYIKGQDYKDAVKMLDLYLKNEVVRRQPQAMTYMGEAMLSLGRMDDALKVFMDCVELHPKDVAAGRARLLAAKAYREKNKLKDAENLLLDNLNGDFLTPVSKEWRDSLFMLGEILFAENRYADAARRLEEAVKRFPDLPETIYMRYLLADTYCRTAREMQDKLKKDLAGNSRVSQSKQIFELYAKSLEQYRYIQEKLSQTRDSTELSGSQRALLRNCYFSIGDMLFLQGNFEAAVKAYFTATNRYQNSPEVLNAYEQIANAYRRLGKTQEAKNAVQQAKVALSRMKNDVPFEKTTNYTRTQWAERLDMLAAQ